jgi:hypothetical protein
MVGRGNPWPLDRFVPRDVEGGAMGQGLFDDTEMRIARKRLKGLRNV